jgi:hypothetical protein
MPGLLPIILTGSFLVLVADKVPELNIEPSCRAAAKSGVRMTDPAANPQDDSACKRDETTARDKLVEEWGQFTPTQRDHCVRLSSLGGSPSYVELLTCLELAKQAAALPAEEELRGPNKP